tara:strand:+ start:679 stop:897 length:219 start_codon:yes stop_codon:yes gene_type:complete
MTNEHKFTYTNKERTEAIYRGQLIKIIRKWNYTNTVCTCFYKPAQGTNKPLFIWETSREFVKAKIDRKLDWD